LFSAGLVLLLWHDDRTIGLILLGLFLVIGILYFASTFHPVFSANSPFRTPLSSWVLRYLQVNPGQASPQTNDLQRASPQTNDLKQKMKAICWMLQQSADCDGIDSCMQEFTHIPNDQLAGLPLLNDKSNQQLIVEKMRVRLLKFKNQQIQPNLGGWDTYFAILGILYSENYSEKWVGEQLLPVLTDEHFLKSMYSLLSVCMWLRACVDITMSERSKDIIKKIMEKKLTVFNTESHIIIRLCNTGEFTSN